MGQIEELPDDFDESMHLGTPSPPQPAVSNNNNNTTSSAETPVEEEEQIPFPIKQERLKDIQDDPTAAPEMPPAMASVKTNTTEELMDMMNKTPLFMTDLDKARDESK